MSTKLIQHAIEHPPRCVVGFQVDPTLPLLKEMPYPQDLASFALRCPCGSASGNILGYNTINESYPDRQTFIGPLALECSDCGSVTELMDPRQDGYDAEFGHCYSMTGEGSRSRFRCSKCGAELMEVAAGFEYSIDEEDLESDEEMAEHQQDFFTWFTLYGRCKSCGAVQEVSEYECA